MIKHEIKKAMPIVLVLRIRIYYAIRTYNNALSVVD